MVRMIRKLFHKSKNLNITLTVSLSISKVPEMDGVSAECKDLIQKILVPAEKRMTVDQIFNHPWMLKELSNKPLKVSFSKVQGFAKFSKVKFLSILS